jgi:hypothetical protein
MKIEVMKKKDLKKITKLIMEQFENRKESLRSEEEYRAEYDSDVSDKVKKLILNIIKYKENININIREEQFNIYINDFKSIKNQNMNGKISDDNCLEMSIDKLGFYINLGYKKRSRYKDENLFNELLPLIRKRNKEINNENFDEIWSEIMIGSGIIRDNNLDELGI